MAGTKQRDPRKEAAWRKWFRRQLRSGMSVREFCLQYGLAESSFHFWRREIARRDREATAGAAAPAFLPILVQNESAPFEVVLTSGRMVRVPAGFNASALRQLLALLEEPSC